MPAQKERGAEKPLGPRQSPGLQEWLLGQPRGWWTTILRMVLALAVAVSSKFSSSISPHRTVLIAICVVYAAALLLWAIGRQPFSAQANAGTAIVDTAFVALLILIGIESSAVYLLCTFVLLNAALEWGMKGALSTALILWGAVASAEYAGGQVGASGSGREAELLFKSGYLLVTGVMMGYIGSLRLVGIGKLTQLAEWPTTGDANTSEPELAPLLRHAAKILGARRILVLWDDENLVHSSALWDSDSAELSQGAKPATEPEMAELLGVAAFLARVWQGQLVFGSGARTFLGGELRSKLANAIGDDVFFASAAFRGSRHWGRVYIVDPKPLSEEILPLVQTVASRIGTELEHFANIRQISVTAAARERLRVARDLHDSILQDLTAAGLQLKFLSRSQEAQSRVEEISELILKQQRRIRQLATPVTPEMPPPRRFAFAQQVERLSAELSQQWRCQVPVMVNPANADVPWAIATQTCYIISEAVANAVRHGQASEVMVEIGFEDSKLWLVIADNGHGMGSETGSKGVIAPVSLVGRVSDMGGSCEMWTSPEGTKLLIKLPCT
jgi:signal transduction histidine kinase